MGNKGGNRENEVANYLNMKMHSSISINGLITKSAPLRYLMERVEEGRAIMCPAWALTTPPVHQKLSTKTELKVRWVLSLEPCGDYVAGIFVFC